MKILTKSNARWAGLALVLTVFGTWISTAEDIQPRKDREAPPPRQAAPGKSDEKAKEEPAEEESEFFTYVVFLPSPREHSTAKVKEWAAAGFANDHETAAKFKVRKSEGGYQIVIGKFSLEVEFGDEPWLGDVDQIISESKDKRLREMLRKAKAYVSITLEDNFDDDEEAREAAEATLLRVLSGFAALSDSLAVYDDNSGDFNYVNAEVIETLAGDDPLSAFEIEVMPPVIMVDGDSEEMKSAIAEARRRWPEFVLAFKQTGKDVGPFLIKAEFKDRNDSEFMWCEVAGISGGRVSAVLKNEPVTLKSVAAEDKVELPVSRIVDWIYANTEGERVGGFTMDLVGKAYSGKQSAPPKGKLGDAEKSGE